MKKKIVFICSGNPKDRKNWSGTISYMAEALEKKYEVEYIRVDENPQLGQALLNTKLMKMFSFKRNVRNMAISKASRKYIENKVNSIDCDLIFAPAVSEYIALCSFKKPVIYLTDATFHALLDYYIYGASKHDIVVGNKVEEYSLKLCSQAVFSSKWAADDAVSYYKISPDKVHVIPFGANIATGDYIPDRHNLGREVKLLFVGADWRRKGGIIAIETMKWLNANDKEHEYSIDIVGTDIIDSYENEPFVRYHGFINKNEPTGMSKITQLYKNASIYIIPTKAECCSMTYQEASSFGLPSITYNTGGTSSGVENGINGYLLEEGSSPEEFGIKILEMIKDDKYTGLCKTTYEYYKDRLTWDAWLKDISKLIEDLCV